MTEASAAVAAGQARAEALQQQLNQAVELYTAVQGGQTPAKSQSVVCHGFHK